MAKEMKKATFVAETKKNEVVEDQVVQAESPKVSETSNGKTKADIANSEMDVLKKQIDMLQALVLANANQSSNNQKQSFLSLLPQILV